MKKTRTHEVKIFIAGDIQTITAVCRRFCLTGICVSVTPAAFIFTGGAETGAIIGLINYARFPKESAAVDAKAVELATILMDECCQRSCSVVMPEETIFLENASINEPR